ncbi:MAG: Ca2+-dependent phosphoinositide-specific phospholipase C [Myxococcota bacterium]
MNARTALVASLALMGCPLTSSSNVDGGPAPFVYAEDDVWTMFQIQAKGTHNSYHYRGDADLLAWNYTHAPLDEQAERQGVRAFELDLHWMPDAGGVRVFHIPYADQVSTCLDLRACFSVLRAWSDAHPMHHPMVIQMEAKGNVTPDVYEAFTQAAEAIAREVWGEKLITPAMVQGDAPTLAEGVRRGWPTLRQTRGKVLLAWDDAGGFRDFYTHGGQDLDGRLMFVNSEAGQSFAAFAVLNDPIADQAKIVAALSAGLLVRTRADADSVEPSQGDRSRLQAALESGAHIVTTDYPAPDGGWDYWVEIPGGTPSRCNPVTSGGMGRACTAEALEDPRSL